MRRASLAAAVITALLFLVPVEAAGQSGKGPAKVKVDLVWDYDAGQPATVVAFDVWRVDRRGKRLEKLGTWEGAKPPTTEKPMPVELAPGRHWIHVVARDNDGIESEPAKMELNVPRQPSKRKPSG
jgi:hypothetical protein